MLIYVPTLLQVQKSARHYTEAARDEIKLLTEIRDGDPGQSQNCVQLRDSFEHSGPHGTHVCMVFEVRSLPIFATPSDTSMFRALVAFTDCSACTLLQAHALKGHLVFHSTQWTAACAFVVDEACCRCLETTCWLS